MAAAAAFRGTVDLAAGAAGADDDDEDDAGEGQEGRFRLCEYRYRNKRRGWASPPYKY